MEIDYEARLHSARTAEQRRLEVSRLSWELDKEQELIAFYQRLRDEKEADLESARQLMREGMCAEIEVSWREGSMGHSEF